MNLLYRYSAAGDMEAVLATWNNCREKDGKKDRLCSEAYNIVMSIFTRERNDLGAVNMFYKMIDEGGIPNSRTYTVMMEHLQEIGFSNGGFRFVAQKGQADFEAVLGLG
ncbi:unnamed protein product [Linum tenue]|uniref:Pentatricopeptide repeat-containing protein n=1 Tax=Linum tenue TaxID=586396 RepID=A0AAV0L577_9ROSI|nr:unnamed protein product [Linum tenue]